MCLGVLVHTEARRITSGCQSPEVGAGNQTPSLQEQQAQALWLPGHGFSTHRAALCESAFSISLRIFFLLDNVLLCSLAGLELTSSLISFQGYSDWRHGHLFWINSFPSSKHSCPKESKHVLNETKMHTAFIISFFYCPPLPSQTRATEKPESSEKSHFIDHLYSEL